MAFKIDKDNLGGGIPNKLNEATDKVENSSSSNTTQSNNTKHDNNSSSNESNQTVKVNIPLLQNVANKIKDAVDNMASAVKSLNVASSKLPSANKSPKVTEAKIQTTETTSETAYLSSIWDKALQKYNEMEEELKDNIANLKSKISAPVALSGGDSNSVHVGTSTNSEKLETEEFYQACEANGVSSAQMKADYFTVVERRGQREADLVLNGFVQNRPSNFADYNFHPVDLDISNANASSYYFDPNEIGEYHVNSETLGISGVDFEFVQVLPNDCTALEQITYDYAKANFINTARTLPSNMLTNGQNTSGTKVILTCSNDAMNVLNEEGNKNTNWGGFYNYENDVVTVDAHGTLINNEYYTRDVVIHELAHRFDDIYADKENNTNWQSDKRSWQTYRDEDIDIIPPLVKDGYVGRKNDGSVNDAFNQNEFFAETVVAYAINSLALKNQAPREYNAVQTMLGEDTAGFYNKNINAVLNGTLKNYEGSLVQELLVSPEENTQPSSKEDLIDNGEETIEIEHPEIIDEGESNVTPKEEDIPNSEDYNQSVEENKIEEPKQDNNESNNQQTQIEPEKPIISNKLKDYDNQIRGFRSTNNESSNNKAQYNRNDIYTEAEEHSYIPPVNTIKSLERWSLDYETNEIAIYANNYYTMLENGDLDMPDEDDVMINMLDKWNKLYEDNKEKLKDLQYKDCPKYQNMKEFFINMMIIYFKKPDDLRKLSPEVYDSYTEIFGADSGGTW